jgi:hypothetical protein
MRCSAKAAAPAYMPDGRQHELTMFAPSADAMNEVAWCYLEGFGTKKDKVSVYHHQPSLHNITRAIVGSPTVRVLPAGQQWCHARSAVGGEERARPRQV